MRCLCIILFCLLTYQYLSAQEKIIGYKADIEPYVSFINEQQLSPVTYLLRKYQTHDVIVLGERDHRDLTQYYFIEKLLNTEEFYKKVGVIYTEVGSSNFNDTLNKVLKNLTLSEDEIYRRLLGIYREISYEAFWDKYNFFYLWKTLYHFNHVHPDYPITLMMTSYPFHWNEIRDTIQCRAKTNEVEKSINNC